MKLTDVLGSVRCGPAVQHEGLQVFPLHWADGDEPAQAPGYVVLDELLERHGAAVTELDDGGHVPTIKVRNDADVDALILDGTELRGAKQNRMVNVSIVVGKHTEIPIPVSCVERGRWGFKGRAFESSGRTVASKLRNLKAHMVKEHLSAGRRAATDQGAVWDSVDAYMERSATASPTAAMDDVFSQEGSTIDAIVDALRDLDAAGAIVAVNGEIVGLDLVDRRSTFRKLWSGLVRGYAVDAVLEAAPGGKSLTGEEVESWLRTVTTSGSLERAEVPGVGEYHAVRGNGLAGGVVLHEGRVVHAAVFPAVDEEV